MAIDTPFSFNHSVDHEVSKAGNGTCRDVLRITNEACTHTPGVFFNNYFRLWVKQEPCVNAISCFSHIVHNGSANKQPRH